MVRGPVFTKADLLIPARRDRPLGRWLFWIAHAAFWLAMFAAVMVVILAFKPALESPAAFVGVRVAFGFLFTAGLRTISKHRAIMRRLGLSKIGLMVGGPLIGAVAMTVLMPVIEHGTNAWLPAPSQPVVTIGDIASPRLGLMARFLLNLAMLAIWCLLYFGSQLLRDQRQSELRVLEAESLASRNELRHLQSQISPHFLFNALNTVLACKHDPDSIEAVTQALAKYLRFLLRPVGTLEPLGREIDALEQYLTIQSFRFGDRLVCRIDCDTDVRRIPVLPVMIQPLVENALKYGDQGPDRPLEVSVRAWRTADRLMVEVTNTGRWASDGQADSTGTGLHGLRRRLFLHGGTDATVTTSQGDGWVRVTVTIPLAAEFIVGGSSSESTEKSDTISSGTCS
jgi:hypothetical protein